MARKRMIAWISLIIIVLKKSKRLKTPRSSRSQTQRTPFLFDFPSVSVKLHTIALQWFMSLNFHELICAICPCDPRNDSPSVCVRHVNRDAETGKFSRAGNWLFALESKHQLWLTLSWTGNFLVSQPHTPPHSRREGKLVSCSQIRRKEGFFPPCQTSKL